MGGGRVGSRAGGGDHQDADLTPYERREPRFCSSLHTRYTMGYHGGPATKRSYVAITLAGRRPSTSTALQRIVARVVDGDAKIVRSARGVTIVREQAPGEDARVAAEQLRQLVGRETVDEITAGVAGPRQGAAGAHFAFMQSEHAVSVGRGLHGHGRTIHFDQLGRFRFVLNQPASEIEAFAKHRLGDLLEDPRSAALLDTLECYLRSNGRAHVVAQKMSLHRNTVRQRLHRIVELTGADLADPDTRLALQLAILGFRALEQIAS